MFEREREEGREGRREGNRGRCELDSQVGRKKRRECEKKTRGKCQIYLHNYLSKYR